MAILSASARRNGNSPRDVLTVMSFGPDGTMAQWAEPLSMEMPRSFSSMSTLLVWPAMSHLPLAWEMETSGAPHSARGSVWARRGAVDTRNATAIRRGLDCITTGWTPSRGGWFQASHVALCGTCVQFYLVRLQQTA